VSQDLRERGEQRSLLASGGEMFRESMNRMRRVQQVLLGESLMDRNQNGHHVV
jgi:hypothetical protein